MLDDLMHWEQWEWFHWLLLGGGAVAVVALLLYFAAPRLSVPAGIASTLAAFAFGVGAGAVGLTALGYSQPHPATRDADDGGPGGGPGGGGPGGGGPGGGPGGGMKGPGKGMPGGGGPGGMMAKGKGTGKGKGPSPKTQLATLVTKLEQLTDKNLTLTFSKDERQTLLKNLADLPKLEQLEDDMAQDRLKALLAVVEKQRETLEAAGYRWPEPGGGFQFPPPPPPNPFAQGEDQERLLTLQATLGGKGAKKE
jgi:hypothetical protein